MSSDGNKSKNIAPFTMFSSSATGGYLADVHTRFTGGVEINDLHTDVYGDFRHPPAQGTFTSVFVGGNTHRHHPVGSTDRTEAFMIDFGTPASYLFEGTTTEITPIAGAPVGTDMMFELDAFGNIQPLDPPAVEDENWVVDAEGNITTNIDAIVGTGLLVLKPSRPALFRDEFARRPVNIRNIRQQSPGNFSHTREIIHTAGRTSNPGAVRASAYSVTYPLFPKNENPVLNTPTTDEFPGGLADYAMPELSSSASAHVFVNRFSSPGDRYTMSRGFLNPIGEEYSAYNTMPFRNLNVRAEKDENMKVHNAQFAANHHPVNRNTGYKSAGSPLYDNGNVTHAIPQNTLQYSWITASAEDTIADFQGFATGSDLSFYSGTIGFDPPDLDSPMNSVFVDEDNNTQDFDFTGSVYGYNTWKQIRGGELKLSRHYRENSILAAANGRGRVTQFSEPAVVAKHKPMEHVLGIDETSENYIVRSAYGNELVRHSNEDLNTLFAFIRSDETTYYNKLKHNYIDRSIDDPANPIKRFVSMTYGETVFPRPVNAFRNKVRVRGNYTEVAGTGDNGYDRLYGTQNTMYSSTGKRSVTAQNSQGIVDFSLAFDPMKTDGADSFPGTHLSDATVADAVAFWRFNEDLLDSSDSNQNGTRLPSASGDFTYEAAPFPLAGRAITFDDNDEYIDVGTPEDWTDLIGNDAPNPSTYSFAFWIKINDSQESNYSRIMNFGETDLALYYKKDVTPNSIALHTNWQSGGETKVFWDGDAYLAPGEWTHVVITHQPGGATNTYADWQEPNLYINGTPVSNSGIQFNITPTPSGSPADFENENTHIANRDAEDRQLLAGMKDLIVWNKILTPAEVASLYEEYQTRQSSVNVGELNLDTDTSMDSNVSPTASLSFFETNHAHVASTDTDYNERLVEEMSGKTRWYDSYDLYQENSRGLLPEASVIPEFRISEHMDYYIDEAAGNFRADNKKFLTLLGHEYDASTTGKTARVKTTFDSDFESTLLTSGELEHFEKIKKDHLGHSKPKRLTLKAAGVKKLLPYNGFYPDTRTVQLGNLLSQSIAPNIQGYLTVADNPTKAEQFLDTSPAHGNAAILKTIASPGILYNTIKSGLAVDYPIYTSQPATASLSNNPTNVLVLSSEETPSSRLPFETLVNLNENLPKDERVFLVGAHPHQATDGSFTDSSLYYGKWNGKKKPYFEIASHNYLAESVNFFLKNSEVNSFISKPQNEFAEVEADKTYYMDIVLRDEVQMNKFAEYSGISSSFPVYEVVDQNVNIDIDGYNAPSSYGQVAKQTATVSDGSGGAYVLFSDLDVLSSFGTKRENAYLTHTDAAGNTTLLEEISAPVAGGNFGHRIAMVSGSDALYFAISAPDIDNPVPNINPPAGGGNIIDFYEQTGGIYFYKYEHDTETLTMVQELVAGNSTNNFYKDRLREYNTLGGQWELRTYPSADMRLTSYKNGTDLSMVSGSGGIYVGHVNTHFAIYDNTMGTPDPNYSGTDQNWVLATVNRYTGTTWKSSWNILPEYSSSIFTGPTITVSSGSASIFAIVGTSDLSGTANNDGHFTILSDDLSDFYPALSMSIDITSSSPYDHPIGSLDSISNHDVSNENLFFTIGTLGPGTITMWVYGYDGTTLSAHYGSHATSLDNESGPAFLKLELDPSTSNQVYIAIPSGGDNSKLPENRITLARAEIPAPGSSSPSFSILESQDIYPKPGFEGLEEKFGYGLSLHLDSDGKTYLSCGQPTYSSGLGNVQLIYSAPRTHVYSQHGRLFGLPTDNAYDPAYIAYTPPGFHGERVATISFSSSIGGAVTLDEILRSSTVLDTENTRLGQVSSFGGDNSQITNEQNTSKMPLASSVSLFGKTKQPDVEFQISEIGEATRVDRAKTAGKEAFRWAVSTRYECPVIDVSSSLYEYYYDSHEENIETNPVWDFTGDGSFSHPRSVWTSYGRATAPDKGYFFELRESTSKGANDGSLVELCGFTPGTKKVGTVADNKVISEAIMVIPYVDKQITSKNIRKGTNIGKISKTVEIESGKHFFRLNNAELKRQKKSVEDNGYAVSEDLRETSISELIRGMKDYVIPPHYNFLQYNDIKPFACYFLEFEHTLSQRDLIDIWQGITPSIALNPETDEVEISHDIDKHNLFHNIDIPSDIKFMIFKVKKKAMWNYYDITTDSTDDNRFRFDFQGDGKVEVVPDYNYNWPYDFFSLVERAKVDVDITFKKDDEE